MMDPTWCKDQQNHGISYEKIKGVIWVAKEKKNVDDVETKKTHKEAGHEANPVEEETAKQTTDQIEDKKAEIRQALEEKIDELNDQKLRVMAEYDNYKKRTQKEKQDIYRVAEFDTILKILPIFDNLERGLENSTSDENVRKGMEMTYNQSVEVLHQMGVEEIASLNQPFDPEVHNAVMHVEDPAVGSNTIVEVFQKGYEKDGKVIRHAMVKVAN